MAIPPVLNYQLNTGEMRNPDSYKQDFKRLKCCVLIPSYNNAQKIGEVIESVSTYCDDIIVINDGCTDHTDQVLKLFPDIQVVHQPKNQGKGVALRKGFKYAFSKGYLYAVTLDSDGQHKASDLPVFLEKLEENKNTLYIGSRNMTQDNVPGKSSFGHKFSNFWFWVETGIDAPDTQSGYRLYPLLPLQKMRFITWRYEFEVEVIVKAAWAGVEVSSVPIDVYYPPQNERITHFRPFKDFTRISILNTALVTMALLYYIPLRLIRSAKKKSLKENFRILFQTEESPGKKSIEVAFGVFMGIVPLWGFQMLAAAALARLLRFNIPTVLLASNISIPPMIPFIIFGSMWLGGLALHISEPFLFSFDSDMEDAKLRIQQYLTGSLLLAIISALLLGSLTYLCLLFAKKDK